MRIECGEEEDEDEEDKFGGVEVSKIVVGGRIFDDKGGCEKDGGGGGGGKERVETIAVGIEFRGTENVGICGTNVFIEADCEESGIELGAAVAEGIVAVDVVKAANCFAISLEVAATISIMFSLCSLLSLSCLPSCSAVENCLRHSKQATTSLAPVGAVDDDEIGAICFPVIAIDGAILLLVELFLDVSAKGLIV